MCMNRAQAPWVCRRLVTTWTKLWWSWRAQRQWGRSESRVKYSLLKFDVWASIAVDLVPLYSKHVLEILWQSNSKCLSVSSIFENFMLNTAAIYIADRYCMWSANNLFFGLRSAPIIWIFEICKHCICKCISGKRCPLNTIHVQKKKIKTFFLKKVP